MDPIKTTVIIPTLYRVPELLNALVAVLQKQNCFIHLIDNSPHKSCTVYEGRQNIRISCYPENIGVNKAWNTGVGAAKTDYYLLLNDDCLVWNYVIQTCEGILEDQSVGIVTFNTVDRASCELYQRLFTNHNSVSRLVSLERGARIGWFIFGRTSQWVAIPDVLHVFYGDDFIFRMARKRNLKTVMDLNNFIYHHHNITTSPHSQDTLSLLLKKEQQLFAGIMREYNIEDV
jgi:GT2 family glycosyltransferase